MLIASLLMLAQVETRATQPTFFIPVMLVLLIGGGLGWLIAAVLGFSRARAFGPAIRWFALSAVCLVIFHLHFLLLGILAAFGARNDNDFGSVLSVGAFFNLFVVLGAICSIMGFVKLTEQR